MDYTGIDSEAVVLRPERYKTLFMGELPYEPLPPEAQVGIASLSRITERSGGRTTELSEHLGKIPGLIDKVLLEHDKAAASGNEALFAFVDGDARQRVGNIVSNIFVQWEVISQRRKLNPILTTSADNARWLVVETAAAVMASGVSENSFDLAKNKSDADKLAKIISCWGPEFTRQWFNGTVLNQWLDEQQLTGQERADWQSTFKPSIRKYVAASNNNDPLAALRKVKTNLDTILTDENIAQQLGWTEAEVAEIVTPGIRKRFAVMNLANPLAALRKVKTNLETVLTDENIAEQLVWAESEVAEIVTPGIRKHFAVSNITDPMAALGRAKTNLDTILTDENIAQQLGWTEAEVAEIVTPGIRKHFAVSNITDPMAGIKDWLAGNVAASRIFDNSKNNKLKSMGKDAALSEK